MNLNKLSAALYRAARLTRDVKALQQGPTAVAKRLARKAVYRQTNRAARTIIRGFMH